MACPRDIPYLLDASTSLSTGWLGRRLHGHTPRGFRGLRPVLAVAADRLAAAADARRSGQPSAARRFLALAGTLQVPPLP